MAEFSGRHPLHDASDGVGLAAGRDLAGHHLPTGDVERGGPVLGQRLHDVALRHDADDAPSGAANHNRADAPRGQKFGRSRKIAVGSMVTMSPPLAAKLL